MEDLERLPSMPPMWELAQSTGALNESLRFTRRFQLQQIWHTTSWIERLVMNLFVKFSGLVLRSKQHETFNNVLL